MNVAPELDLSTLELTQRQVDGASLIANFMSLHLDRVQTLTFGNLLYAMDDAMTVLAMERDATGEIPVEARIAGAIAMREFGYEVLLPESAEYLLTTPHFRPGGQDGQ